MTKTRFAAVIAVLTGMQPVSMLFAHNGRHEIQTMPMPDQLVHWCVTHQGWLWLFAMLLGILLYRTNCSSKSGKPLS